MLACFLFSDFKKRSFFAHWNDTESKVGPCTCVTAANRVDGWVQTRVRASTRVRVRVSVSMCVVAVAVVAGYQ